MKTFKEYLIEYSDMAAPSFNEPEEGKQDVSMNGDDELIQWVINDEGLYNLASSVGSFDELMQDIDTLFSYNNDQYNALARAYRMGDLRDEQQEEEEAKVPAKRDRQMAINNWIDDTDKPVPLSRMKSQENRFRKRLYGKNK